MYIYIYIQYIYLSTNIIYCCDLIDAVWYPWHLWYLQAEKSWPGSCQTAVSVSEVHLPKSLHLLLVPLSCVSLSYGYSNESQLGWTSKHMHAHANWNMHTYAIWYLLYTCTCACTLACIWLKFNASLLQLAPANLGLDPIEFHILFVLVSPQDHPAHR